MIKFDKTRVVGWEPAIRGMRNPMNSWEKSDSGMYGCDRAECGNCGHFEYCECLGPNDHELMMKLANGGPVHAKYRRMITVYVDITAPLYWWKEFDTYKVGTVANSCSTMHKIHAYNFTEDDFSVEHLYPDGSAASDLFKETLRILNLYRNIYINGQGNPEEKDFIEPRSKKVWWQMIQLLPSSYNQKRTVMLNYEVLVGIYKHRKNHKLDEWRELCSWIESLPYSEIITGVSGDEEV